jgi:hypothetical protein
VWEASARGFGGVRVSCTARERAAEGEQEEGVEEESSLEKRKRWETLYPLRCSWTQPTEYLQNHG